MQLRLLGPLELIVDGSIVAISAPKERLMLAVLAVHANRVVPEDTLVDALWHDQPPRTAVRTLQALVSRLRRTLGSGSHGSVAISTGSGGYMLVAPPGTIDVAAVEQVAGDAAAAMAAGDCAGAASGLAEALSWWRGIPLGEFADEPFAVAEVARLNELQLSLIEQRLEADLACGHHRDVVRELEALTGAQPMRERLWALRMLALYRSGRQADALRAFQEVRLLLRSELGLEPTGELRVMEQAILEQSPELDWRQPGAADQVAIDLPTGVVTFVLTDIEGSTALWDLDPDAMAHALDRHDHLVFEAVVRYGGRLVKSKGEGDSTLSVFTRASDAVRAAAEMQRLLAAEPWPSTSIVRIRAAVHTGEAYERDGDYFGPTVNRAARLRTLAMSTQVLVSSATAGLVRDRLGRDLRLVAAGTHHLRGVTGEEPVFALAGPDLASDVVAPQPPPTAEPGPGDVEVSGEAIEPHVQWARTAGDVRIAYAVFGSGSPVVFPSNIWGDVHLIECGPPHRRRMVRRLVELGRQVVAFDGRGMGASDRGATDFSLEARLEDLDAVLDRLDLPTFALCGRDHAAPTAVTYAAAHPDAVSHLILVEAFFPGIDADTAVPVLRAVESMRELAQNDWEHFTLTLASLVAGLSDDEQARKFAAAFRSGMAQNSFLSLSDASRDIDVSSVLPSISVPTLVVHNTSFVIGNAEHSRAVASSIPGAELVTTADPSRAIDDFIGPQHAGDP